MLEGKAKRLPRLRVARDSRLAPVPFAPSLLRRYPTTSSPSYTALHRPWTLTERALGQSASATKRSVVFASRCSP